MGFVVVDVLRMILHREESATFVLDSLVYFQKLLLGSLPGTHLQHCILPSEELGGI